MYNHKQRKDIEKALGLHKEYQKMSSKDKAALRKRRAEVGKEIQLRNQQELENSLIQQEAERYARQLQGLIDSGTDPDKAQKIVENNKHLAEERARKKAERRERQKNQ